MLRHTSRGCKICWLDKGLLLKVCLCDDLVHRKCIMKWQKIKKQNGAKYKNCEVCKSPYIKINRVNKNKKKNNKFVFIVIRAILILYATIYIIRIFQKRIGK